MQLQKKNLIIKLVFGLQKNYLKTFSLFLFI